MSLGCLFACLSLPHASFQLPPPPQAKAGAVIGVGLGLRLVLEWGIEPVAGAGGPCCMSLSSSSSFVALSRRCMLLVLPTE